jgi:hypothetical protein
VRCPQRDSNPCYGLERAATWTASRWGPKIRSRLPGARVEKGRPEKCRQRGHLVGGQAVAVARPGRPGSRPGRYWVGRPIGGRESGQPNPDKPAE